MTRTRTRSRSRGCAVLLAMMVMGAGVHPALAQTFVVNDTADITDANAGDGVCETGAGTAQCTLRAAIQEANALAAAGMGPALIELPAGTYTLAIAGTGEDDALTGDLDINASMTLQGAGAEETILEGAELDRVLDVAPTPVTSFADVEVILAGVTVRGGSTSDGESGGGIRYAGALVVQESTVANNVSADSGGGISTNGNDIEPQLTVIDSTIADNQATSELVFSQGGGIFASGLVTITRSTIRGNHAGVNGGGVRSEEDAVVTDSIFTDNISDQGGGGGINAGCLTVSGSVFAQNTSEIGGGVQVDGSCDSSITNTTISGNTANFQGGGVFIASGGGSLTLTYVTVADNDFVSTDPGAGGGGLFRASGFETKPVRLQNTLLSANEGANCAGNDFESLGNNLDSDGTCAFMGPGDLSIVDPLLGPLADNGGSTLTHALGAGSPAIDAAATIDTITTDQRGSARPVDGNGDGIAASDIGAYESPAKKKKKRHHFKLKRLRHLIGIW